MHTLSKLRKRIYRCPTLMDCHRKVSQILEAEMIYQICSKTECEGQYEGIMLHVLHYKMALMATGYVHTISTQSVDTLNPKP
jgi:hypothetical protein